MTHRTSVQSAQQSGGDSTGIGWRSQSRSSLGRVALVVLTIAIVSGVAVVGAASGTAGAASADATGVAALQDDSTLDAQIEYIDDPSAESVTVDASRESIGFTGFGSSDASTDGLSHLEFEWSVGENATGSIETTGNYSTDFFASYELGAEDAGTSFDVQLTIADENGTTATDSFTVHVSENDSPSENVAPTASVVWADDPSVDRPVVTTDDGTVRLSAADSTDPDGDADALTYEWDVSPMASGSHAREDGGAVLAYDVAPEDEGRALSFEVTVTDSEGANDTMAMTLDVAATAEPDSVTADASPIDAPGSDSITVDADSDPIGFDGFTSSYANGSRSDLDFEWSVEGNASGQLVNTGQYDDEWFTSYELGPDDAGATFDVVLTVTAPDGTSDTDSVTVQVASENDTQENAAPDADLVWAANASIDAPTVTVDEGSFELSAAGTTDADHDTDDLTFAWSAADATGDLQPAADGQTATYDLAATDAGTTISVEVEVTDPEGATDTATIDVAVDPAADGEAPTANVTWPEDPTAQQVTVEQSVDSFLLSPESTVDPNYDLANLTLEWSVDAAAAGELNVSEEPFAVYHASNADRGETLTFTLEVTNDDGYSDTDAIDVTFEAADADPPTAAIDALDAPGDAEIDVHPDNESVGFSAFASSDPQYEFTDLEFEWAVGGDVSGELVGANAYDEDWYATYELGPNDANSSFDVQLTVINAAGLEDTASITVNVAAAGNQSDDDQNGTDDDQDGTDDGNQGEDDDSPSSIGPISSPSDDDDDGGSDADDPSPSPFAFSFDSSADSVVLTGEHAQAGSSASVDLAVVLGGLQLERFEGEAAETADAFEVTIATSDRSGPDVDGDVVQVLDVEDDDMLAASTLDFGVADSASDADAGDATLYEYRDGEWHESEGVADDGSMSTDVANADALAVVTPSSEEASTPDDDGGDDSDGGDDGGIGPIAIVLLIGVLVVVGGVEYYRRQ